MNKARHRTNRRLEGFEALEARHLLTSFGVPWPESTDLTLSFAPDGTQIGSQSSELFRALDNQAPNRTWEEEVLRAFQTWAVNANINVGLVADGGQPLGSLGLKQGDPRFGDVRIGAFPMANDVLAVADPYDPFVANTWVGDVFLNSDINFSADSQNAGYDLFSVLLHEACHVFGLDHSTDPSSPMFERFHTAEEPSLTAADISRLQALYGARLPDAFDATGSNGTLASATPLSIVTADGRAGRVTAEGDITTLDDVDVYRIVVPDGVQSLDVRLVAAGSSLLMSRMSLLNAAGDPIASDTSLSPLQNNVHLAIRNAKPGDVYYVKLESGRTDVFGVGSYHLEVTPQGPGAGASGANVGGSSYATNGSALIGTASGNSPIELTTTPGYVEHTYYEVDSEVGPIAASQTFRVRSADLGDGVTNVMTVVLAPDDATAALQVSILDDSGHSLPASVIYNARGQIELQVPSVVSNRDYLVQVSSSQDLSAPNDYELTVDFDADGAHLETYVNDSLTALQPEVVRTLNVLQSQQFHLVLSASDWNNAAASGLEMQIVNAAGRQIFALAVADGAMRSRDVFLDAGQYTVRFASPERKDNTVVTFELNGVTMSEPIGPQLRDTTLQPVEAPVEVALSTLSFYWLPGNVAAASAPFNQPPATSAPSQAMAGSLATGSVPTAMLPPQMVLKVSAVDEPFYRLMSPGTPVATTVERRIAVQPTQGNLEPEQLAGVTARVVMAPSASQLRMQSPGAALKPPHRDAEYQTRQARAHATVPVAAAESMIANVDERASILKSTEGVAALSANASCSSPPEAQSAHYLVPVFAVIAACLSLRPDKSISLPGLLLVLRSLKTIPSLLRRAGRAQKTRAKRQSTVGVSGDWSIRESGSAF